MEDKGNENQSQLLLTYPEYFNAFAGMSLPHRRAASCAERMGVILQEKMTAKGYLENEDVKEAACLVSPKKGLGCLWMKDATSLLVKTWVYGVELGRALGIDEEAVYWGRYGCQDFEKKILRERKKVAHKSIFSKILDLICVNRQNG